MIDDIINRLNKKGIRFSLNGESLKVSADIEPSEEDISIIKLNKILIIEYIKKRTVILRSINKVKPQDDYLVSSSQRRLWVLSKFEGANQAYNIPKISRLVGVIDEDAFTKSYQKLLERHEVLRSIFTEDKEGTPRQLILPSTDDRFSVLLIDYSNEIKEVRENLIATFVESEVNQSFNLATGPLIKCSLIKESEGNYIWILIMHHIVSDGWSMGVLHRDWSELYNSELGHKQADLPELTIQYKDYAAWHNSQLSSEEINIHKHYWSELFNGELPVLNLPSDSSRPKVMTYNGASIYRELDKSTVDELKLFGNQQGGTLFITLQTALNILLFKYTGQEDIVIGSPIAGREHPDLEGQIGFYVNTLALRNFFSKKDSVITLYQKVKENTLRAYSHQSYPYDELVEALNLTRDLSRNPLFDVMITYQSQVEASDEFIFSNLNFLPYESMASQYEVAKFDLNFGFEEHNEGLYYSLNYNTDIYSEQQINQMLLHLEKILKTIGNHNQNSIDEYEIVTEKEKLYLTDTLNATKVDYKNDKTILDLFEQQVAKNPDAIAVKFRDTELTYKELNEKSNQLAHYLISKYNIKSDELIGIKLDISLEQVIGVLGVLKSGAAYVPIDKNYPNDRILFIEKDSGIKLLFDEDQWNQFYLMRTLYPTQSPIIKITSSSSMYVIYTSGSTGVPKGCVLNYEGVINYLEWIKEYGRELEYTEVDFFSSLSFDFTVTSLFGALTEGKTLRVYDNQEDLGIQLNKIVLNPNSGWIKLTPAHINLIEETTLKKARSKVFVLGGEALLPEQIKHLRHNPGCRIYNEYGPTEATVGCIVKEVSEKNEPYIGQPIPNTEVYLLDNSLNLVPYGCIGEICIGGVGLAREYLNRPELTKEKFIDNPHKPGERIYRTGDLGRWRETGDIEYFGRIDDQVKIRGYRIELGEIEQTLSSHPNSGQVVVIAKSLNKTSDKDIIAYTTGEALAEDLKIFLKDKLPHYMVPNYYVKLSEIPLTNNGKVDKKALIDPEGTGLQKAEYVAPRTEIEKQLVEIWSEVLKYQKNEIGLKSDFFALGGDSIKAIQLVSRLRNFGFELKLSNVLAFSILEDLAKKTSIITREISQDTIEGEIPLSPIQLSFFDNSFVSGTNLEKQFYHQSFMLHFPTGISIDEAKAVFDKIVEHHDVLRMKYKLSIDGVWNQFNRGLKGNNYIFDELMLPFNLSIDIDIIDGFFQDNGYKFKQKLGFDSLPLLGFCLFQDKEKMESHLLISIHHLVIDLVSWRILFEDIETLLSQLRDGMDLVLPKKTDSFKYWMEKNMIFTNSHLFEKDRNYWKNQNSLFFEKLPLKNQAGSNKFGFNKNIGFSLSEIETERVNNGLNSKNKIDINSLLLTALSRSFKSIFGVEQLKILMEGHGREDYIEDVNVSRTVGWFTSMFPFLLNANQDNLESVFLLQDSLNQIPNKGVGFGLFKYFNNIPSEIFEDAQVAFNYLGDFTIYKKKIDDNNESKSSLNKNLFTYSKYGHGPDINQNLINKSELIVTGKTINRCLEMSIQYSPERIDDHLMLKLIAQFKLELIKISDELCNYNKIIQLPSSFTFKSLKLNHLNNLISDYGEIEDVFPLNASQLGMLFLNETNKESGFYVEQFIDEFPGYLDIERWISSLNKIVENNQALRIVFRTDISNEPIQICLRKISINYKVFDFSIYSDSECKNKVDEIIELDFSELFDLNSGPLFRVKFIKISEDKYIRIWTNHHIIMDGWSTQIFFNQWENSYFDRLPSFDSSSKLSDYFNFTSLINKTETIEYWNKYLLDYEKSITIVAIPSTEDSFILKEDFDYSLNKNTTEKLCAFAQQNKLTINGVVQSLFGILLAKINNTDDVVFSSVVSGRPNSVKSIENLIFNFINIIPVRLKYGVESTFLSIFQAMSNFFFEVEKHQYLPLNESCKSIPGGGSSIKLLFVFENYPSKSENYQSEIEQLEFNRIKVNDRLEFDSTVLCGLEEDRLKFIWKSSSLLYTEKQVVSFFGLFENLINSFVENNNLLIDSISLLRINEMQDVLNKSLGVLIDEPFLDFAGIFKKKSIQYFESSAIVGLKNNYSYSELDDISNKIANYFSDIKNLNKGDVIAIEIDRSEWIPMILLGIAKAGMVFLYIDNNYPESRINYIKDNSNVKYVLNNSELKEIQIQIPKLPNKNKQIRIEESDLLYLIYTSGTTGNPKGCGLTHKNIFNLYLYMQYETDIMSNRPKVLQYTTWSFDLSIQEFINALFSGGELICLSENERSDHLKLTEKIIATNAEIFYLSPSLLNSLMRFEIFYNSKPCLKIIISAGEQLYLSSQINEYITKNNLKLYNFYGPAETHVVTGKEINNENLVPRQDIGKPTCNNEIYILGKNLDLLPIGIIGEIFIGGQSVGPGYINNESENKKRFIKHNIYGRLYKTGDLALRDFDGNIHYIGRSDDQVKINGIRIELDEIIKAIKLNQNVTNAIVIIVEVKPNVKQICAFYTGNLMDREMRNFLIDQIPSYYMPAIIMKLDEMPLNANGKIDKNYLRTLVNESKTYEVIKPKSWLQQELINILSEITHLDTDKIGINFSFYDLGLTSLQFINLVSAINSKYKMAFIIKDIIEANTISGLFSLIMKPNNHSNSLLFSLTGKLDDSKPLLVLFPAYFGEGLYYLELANYLNNNYNVLSCNYYSLEEEQFDTDLFSRIVSKEIDLLGFENVILGGASYGFRVAYRVAFYSSIKIKEILNFDGSVYNDLEDEIETIVKINNYELSNYEGIDKIARINSLDNYISNERKIKYVNDYYIGILNGIDIINFYPENSAVSNFSRYDLTNANIIDVTIEGNHENMLILKNNHKTIKNQINK